jgi:hypothetical protein
MTTIEQFLDPQAIDAALYNIELDVIHCERDKGSSSLAITVPDPKDRTPNQPCVLIQPFAIKEFHDKVMFRFNELLKINDSEGHENLINHISAGSPIDLFHNEYEDLRLTSLYRHLKGLMLKEINDLLVDGEVGETVFDIIAVNGKQSDNRQVDYLLSGKTIPYIYFAFRAGWSKFEIHSKQLLMKAKVAIVG